MDKLKYLVLLVGCNKKNFPNQIALNNFFAAKFLFAIDRRVQRWLRMCEQANTSCTARHQIHIGIMFKYMIYFMVLFT
jgi:hypothetical protein